MVNIRFKQDIRFSWVFPQCRFCPSLKISKTRTTTTKYRDRRTKSFILKPNYLIKLISYTIQCLFLSPMKIITVSVNRKQIRSIVLTNPENFSVSSRRNSIVIGHFRFWRQFIISLYKPNFILFHLI